MNSSGRFLKDLLVYGLLWVAVTAVFPLQIPFETGSASVSGSNEPLAWLGSSLGYLIVHALLGVFFAPAIVPLGLVQFSLFAWRQRRHPCSGDGYPARMAKIGVLVWLLILALFGVAGAVRSVLGQTLFRDDPTLKRALDVAVMVRMQPLLLVCCLVSGYGTGLRWKRFSDRQAARAGEAA